MLVNPSTLYSGGNVKLDQNPYLNIALRQQYRKQAQEDASNQYFSRLPDKLNAAGVRTQDLQNDNGGIIPDTESIKDYWYKNKDDIRRGGMAQQQFLQKIERVKNDIQQSKNRAALQLTIGKEALKPNGWKPREDDHDVLEAMDKPINDPTSKKQDGVSEYGLNDLSLSATPYNSNTQLAHDKAITNGILPDRLPNDAGVFDPNALKVTYQHGYTPEKVDAIANNAIQDVKSNRTMRYHYDDLLHDPASVKQASDALQAHYDLTHKDGQKIIADTPEEMAAGLAMAKYSNLKIPKTFTDQKAIEDWRTRDRLSKEAFQLKKQRISEAGKNARVKAILGGVEIPDVLGSAEINATPIPPKVAIDKAVSGDSQLIPVDNLDSRQYMDVFGKPDKYGQTPNNPVIVDGKKYLIKSGDKYIGDNGQEISKPDVLNSTYNRRKDELKSTQKGIIKPATSAPKVKKDPLGIFN